MPSFLEAVQSRLPPASSNIFIRRHSHHQFHETCLNRPTSASASWHLSPMAATSTLARRARCPRQPRTRVGRPTPRRLASERRAILSPVRGGRRCCLCEHGEDPRLFADCEENRGRALERLVSPVRLRRHQKPRTVRQVRWTVPIPNGSWLGSLSRSVMNQGRLLTTRCWRGATSVCDSLCWIPISPSWWAPQRGRNLRQFHQRVGNTKIPKGTSRHR